MNNRGTHRYLSHRHRQIRSPRVLVAEDDADMRVLITLALRSDGYDVIEAENGAQLVDLIGNMFLGLADQTPIDVIISDVRMPGLSGMEVLAGFRRADGSTPFIIITAFGDSDLHAEAERLGATVIDKPFDIDELRTKVRDLLPPNGSKRTGEPLQ